MSRMTHTSRESWSEEEWGERIDASLGRSFAPPSDARFEAMLRRSGVRPRAGSSRRSGPWWVVPVIVATAAAVVALFVLRPRSEPTTEVAGAGWQALTPVGPLETIHPGEQAVGITRPNVETLYAEMRSCSDQSPMSCNLGGELAASLTESYDAKVKLKPEASNVLHGPYSSAEWPTGTILTGYPEEEVAVLVAERAATHLCCLDVQLPPGSRLRVFTWRVDGLLLTEITPLPEPRLLDLFEAAEMR